MTGGQSVTRAGLLRVLVGVCAIAGVSLFVWAGLVESGRPLVLALVFWVVGSVLSVGLGEDTESVGEAADDADDRRESAHRGAVGPGEKPVGQAEQAADGTAKPEGPMERTSADALETLRERYAQGEMTDAEFERRVEHLLDTEGADADDAALRTVRMRYARGDLSDEQFDRKLDRLAETRTLEDTAEAYEHEESIED